MSFFKSPDDGMFIINGRFDPVAGNRMEAAPADEERRLRNNSDAGDQTAFDQRMADALENLICADRDDSKPQGTTLVLTADWDALTQRMLDCRLIDGTPLPMSEALRLACDADILPGMFNTEGHSTQRANSYGLAASTGRPLKLSEPPSSFATSTA